MIHFDSQTQIFNLQMAHSFYAVQVDAERRLIHVGWGPRPDEARPEDILRGAVGFAPYESEVSFLTQFRPDEILTFGDVTSYQVTLKASFPSLGRPLQPGEAPHLPIRDLRLRYASHEVVTDAQPGLAPSHGRPVRNTSERETLRVRLSDPTQAFRVTACYRLTPEYDILERWCELENLGSEFVAVEVCHFASLHLPRNADELTYVSGAWAREFTPERVRLPRGTLVIESRSLQTGHATNPFFLLNGPGQASEENGTVYFGQLAYSGSWQIGFEKLPTGSIRVHGGYNAADFQLDLGPGERHVTPAFVCGVSLQGWGGASRRMHTFTRERVLPGRGTGQDFRPVLYNSWEATYFSLSEASQIALARKAASIGVELFCVDDGWFGARRSERAGLGDWVPSPEAFPNGLEPLVREVKRLGMQFGLWVEPEMVNPDSDLYRQHPEWIQHFPGRPRTEARHQLILDLGRPEVVAYLYAALDHLVAHYGVDFFKWDMNRLVTEPGSVVGKAIWRRHVEGVYDIMDRLRRRYPELDLQSCSGGGGRVDLGILGRVDQIWVSDNTDPLDRMRIQEGCSLAYPARCMEAWVTDERNHLTRRVTPLQLRFDVAMRGVLGIGASLNELSDAELADYAGYIAFYKRIRHVVQDGDLYRLQRLESGQASVVEYVLRDATEAVYSLAVRDHLVGEVRANTPLRGLRPEAEYAIIDSRQHEISRAAGYELMTLGLQADPAEYPGYSRTFYLRQI